MATYSGKNMYKLYNLHILINQLSQQSADIHHPKSTYIMYLEKNGRIWPKNHLLNQFKQDCFPRKWCTQQFKDCRDSWGPLLGHTSLVLSLQDEGTDPYTRFWWSLQQLQLREQHLQKQKLMNMQNVHIKSYNYLRWGKQSLVLLAYKRIMEVISTTSADHYKFATNLYS